MAENRLLRRCELKVMGIWLHELSENELMVMHLKYLSGLRFNTQAVERLLMITKKEIKDYEKSALKKLIRFSFIGFKEYRRFYNFFINSCLKEKPANSITIKSEEEFLKYLMLTC